MNIGDAARACGLPPKTLRYYEDIGLVVAVRRDNGYREYGEREVHLLRFVARARGLGFSIVSCRALVSLYADKNRASADVRALASERIETIDAKIAELESLRGTLTRLIDACAGDSRPDCPILDDLSSKHII